MLVVSLIISDLSLGKLYRLHAGEHHGISNTWLKEVKVEGAIWMDG